MKKGILILVLLISYLGFGQENTKVNQFNSWWTYSGNHTINTKWSLRSLYSWRRHDFVKNGQQSLARVGINYKVNEKLTVTPGYDWVITFPYGKQPILAKSTEHRIFQQFFIKNTVGRVHFTNRFRFEQRFLERISINDLAQKESDGYKFRQRFRSRFGVSIPINHDKMENNTLFVTAFDEIFLNHGSGTNNHVFDQNWLFVGFGYKLNTSTQFKIGYMNQYIAKSDHIKVENNHSLQCSIVHNLNFTRKKKE